MSSLSQVVLLLETIMGFNHCNYKAISGWMSGQHQPSKAIKSKYDCGVTSMVFSCTGCSSTDLDVLSENPLVDQYKLAQLYRGIDRLLMSYLYMNALENALSTKINITS